MMRIQFDVERAVLVRGLTGDVDKVVAGAVREFGFEGVGVGSDVEILVFNEDLIQSCCCRSHIRICFSRNSEIFQEICSFSWKREFFEEMDL